MNVHLITEVSANLARTGEMTLPDICGLVVPAPQPLTCEISYASVRPVTGRIISVALGNQEIGDLSFSNETGQKQTHRDLPPVRGLHSFRVRCVVAKLPGETQCDEALVWLRSGDATIIKKKYTTTLPIEPFDQTWTLQII